MIKGKRPMKWTKDKPTSPGWYWVRNIVVGADDYEPAKIEADLEESGRLFVDYSCDAEWLDDYGDNYEWAGPMPEPE
jgi:hypothetical protein